MPPGARPSRRLTLRDSCPDACFSTIGGNSAVQSRNYRYWTDVERKHQRRGRIDTIRIQVRGLCLGTPGQPRCFNCDISTTRLSRYSTPGIVVTITQHHGSIMLSLQKRSTTAPEYLLYSKGSLSSPKCGHRLGLDRGSANGRWSSNEGVNRKQYALL